MSDINPGKLVTETGAQYRARMAAEAEAGGSGAQTEAVDLAVEAAAVEALAARVVTPKAAVKGKVTKPRHLAKPKKK
jgi:hypothetical protein